MVAITTTSAALLPLLLFASVTSTSPLPLNINLGAYSPALVVGDGAIEFNGAEAGTNSVVNALKSSGTVVGDTAAPVVTTVAASGDRNGNSGVTIVQANAADPSILTEPASLPVPGSKELGPRSI